jgi:zinc/manganese transport system permease protein
MMLAVAAPQFTWNVVRDITQLFDFQFMVNAFWAGSIVALVAALIGWFMVLRGQAFAGHTLALVGFPGAAGATLIGVSVNYGYFAFCIGAALVIAALPYRAGRNFSESSAVTGLTQAFALACGFLFVSLYAGNLNGITALLFGNFLGITRDQVVTLAAVGGVAVVLLAAMARPLLFASLDGDVALARGVPVRVLGTAYLVLLGVAAAEVSQITGALLVFALLVLPPATAQALTIRPSLSVVLAVIIGLAVTWGGLTAAYYSPYPIGFWVTSLAFGLYVVAQIVRVAAERPALRRESA